MNLPSFIANSCRNLADFKRPSVIAMLFFGFSAGIPILLIFSSLSLWLREAGVSRSAVTFFSWAALGYSFKFIWAPLPDRLPLPFLSAMLGRRRSWILLSQIAIVIAITIMALTDPAGSEAGLTTMAMGAVLLGFSSATQDIVIDAYRIESDSAEKQALLSATYIAGYRIGMIVAGAGALVLASALGSTKDHYVYTAWRNTYLIMAATMSVGIVTTLFVKEPAASEVRGEGQTQEYLSFFLLFLLMVTTFISGFYLSADIKSMCQESLKVFLHEDLLAFLLSLVQLSFSLLLAGLTGLLLMKAGLSNRAMVSETYVEPIRDFFSRYGVSVSLLLLGLVGIYRISDIVLGVISNVFYQDLGFSKDEIAAVVKTFGLIMTLVGGFLGGVLTSRFGVMKILMLGAVLSAATNVLFIFLAQMGPDTLMLYAVISADNLSAGLASAAFIAFLSSLTNISFTAIQYAIFSSLMTLLPKLIGGYSGTMVEAMGYETFFTVTALMGLPVILLVWWAGRSLKISR